MNNTTFAISGTQKRIDRHNLPTSGQNPILHLFLNEAQTSMGRPIMGLSASAGYQAHYLSPNDEKPIPFDLIHGPADDGRCGFWEIDQQLMPGVYGLQIPVFLRRRGYTYIHLKFLNTHPYFLEIHGVEYDPYDSFALGLTTWFRSNCHEHLTSGLRKSMPSTLRPLLIDWLNRDIVEE